MRCTTWVEEQIEETFTFYRLPHTHHKHLKSTNLLERFNQELKRRSLVVPPDFNGTYYPKNVIGERVR